MKLRELINSDASCFGSICSMANALSVEVMARAGFDWLFLDMEHAMTDRNGLVQMLQVLDITGTASFVRPPWNRPELVGWVIDMGAQGVLVPMIENADDARELVRSCRYAPLGHRSWGAIRPMIADANYAPAVGNTSVVCGALIETVGAMEALDEIAAVDGIDVLGVGQSDLAISYGLHPTEGRSNPEHRARLQCIVDTARKYHRATWIHVGGDVAFAREAAAMGFRFIGVDSDFGFVARGAAAVLNALRQS